MRTLPSRFNSLPKDSSLSTIILGIWFPQMTSVGAQDPTDNDIYLQVSYKDWEKKIPDKPLLLLS